MDFEDVLAEVGDFGWYQKKLIGVFLVPTTLISATYVMNVIFMVAVPDHWCLVPDLSQTNLTLDQIKYLSLPKTFKNGRERYSQCRMYDLDYGELVRNWTSGDGNFNQSWPNLDFRKKMPTVQCVHGWNYDRSLYSSNAVTKWDLVCDDDQLPSLILTLSNVGSVLGTLVFGFVSDRIGRRTAFFLNASLVAVAGTLSVLSPNFVVFAIARMLTGASMPSNFQLPFILVVEQVGAKPRSRLICLSWVLWTLGGCLLAVVAYLINDFVPFGLVTTLPILLAFVYWRYLPSSPRHELTRGKFQEAARGIRRIAAENGRAAPVDLVGKLQKIGQSLDLQSKEEKSHSIRDLFRYPQLRKKLLIVTLNWAAISVAYFGLIMNVSNLGGNDFRNYFFLSAVELPSFFLACFLMDKWGRRWTNTTFVLLAGISCFSAVLLPASGGTTQIVASLIGKFGSAAAFMVIYQQAAELYPTPVRSLGMSVGSTVSSLAVIFMPYVVYLGVYNSAIPFLILSCVCLLAGSLSPLVPETLHENLPQSIDDSEKFGTKQKFFSCARQRTETCCSDDQSLDTRCQAHAAHLERMLTSGTDQQPVTDL